MTQALIDFWRQCFDYQHGTSRKEFWLTVLDWFIIGLIYFGGLCTMSILNGTVNVRRMTDVNQLILVILCFPSFALWYRRFNDLGMKAKTINKVIWAWIIISFLTIIPYVEMLYIGYGFIMWILCAFPRNYFKSKSAKKQTKHTEQKGE